LTTLELLARQRVTNSSYYRSAILGTIHVGVWLLSHIAANHDRQGRVGAEAEATLL